MPSGRSEFGLFFLAESSNYPYLGSASLSWNSSVGTAELMVLFLLM